MQHKVYPSRESHVLWRLRDHDGLDHYGKLYYTGWNRGTIAELRGEAITATQDNPEIWTYVHFVPSL